MAIVVKTRTYSTGDALPANYYNQDRDEVIAGVNSIDNAQISPTAGILESKLLFNGTSGHDHSGGVNGKPVSAGAFDLATIGVGTLTANYPVAINAGGTAVVARLLTNNDLDAAAAIVYSKLNLATSIVNADIAVGAAIVESKIAFDAVSGHIHDGTLSAKVPVSNLDPVGFTALQYIQVDSLGTSLQGVGLPRTYVFVDYQDLIVENNVGVNPVVLVNTGFTAIHAYIKTAPTGTGVIATITTTGMVLVASIVIPAGNNSATAVVSASVAAGTYLQLNVTQIGSVIAGSKLTVTLSGATA
jgi:hypothetical protein